MCGMDGHETLFCTVLEWRAQPAFVIVLPGNELYVVGQSGFGELGIGSFNLSVPTWQKVNAATAGWGSATISLVAAGSGYTVVVAGVDYVMWRSFFCAAVDPFFFDHITCAISFHSLAPPPKSILAFGILHPVPIQRAKTMTSPQS